MLGRQSGHQCVRLIDVMGPIHRTTHITDLLSTLRHGFGQGVKRIVTTAADGDQRVDAALHGI